MLMPFGKHKGEHVHKIPRFYLRFILETMELDKELRYAIKLGIDKQEWNPITTRNIDELMDSILCEVE